MYIIEEDLTPYKDLIDEGADICDLLRGNSGNVGDIGELLELAADEIEELRKKYYSYFVDIMID